MKYLSLPCIAALLGVGAACAPPVEDEAASSSEAPYSSPTTSSMLDPVMVRFGFVATATSTGTLDTGNAYFQSLGTNGRSCGSCHTAGEGWSITPRRLQRRFEATDGLDPIFLPHDAANAPTADVSTVEARRQAYSLLLSRGTLRVGLPVKPTSEFVLVAADDPYGFASAAQLSMFRRPLPTTNLRFLTALSWDGRNTPAADPTNITLGLKNQSNGATVNHAKALAPIDDATRTSIVGFEVDLTTAQTWSWAAGALSGGGARGGPEALLTQSFAIGMNDPASPEFTTKVFDIFDAWEGSAWGYYSGARRAVARGQRVFNEKTFATGAGRTGTCSGCHSLPNIGASSTMRFFDVGVSAPERRTSGFPLYTFQNIATGETIQTTDPGRALISGKWADMNRFKVPALRGLASRAPYFHDGSARTIGDVVDHYEGRFGITFEDDEKHDLEMFLSAL